MNTARHAALAHLSAVAERANGRGITPRYAPAPSRAVRFSTTLDDLTIDHTTPGAHGASTTAPTARFPAPHRET
jgi:hypothetical protein